MSRIGFIARNPKTALAGVATLMVAAGITVGSGAFVADQAASDGNSVEAGTADLVLYGSNARTIDAAACRPGGDFVTPAGATDQPCTNAGISPSLTQKVTFDVTNMVPGQSFNRCFYVGNNGDIPLGMRLDVDQLQADSTLLANVLDVKVVREASSSANSTNGITNQTIQRKELASGKLSELAAGAPFLADIDPTNASTDNTKRQPLEAQQGQRYCVQISLPNVNADQDNIEGGKVSFGVNALGQSIVGQDVGLDAGRS
jgi:hypothetical protein